MYHSNIHSEHGGSSNHSSRSGHHEWLSSILLSSGEGALRGICVVFNPLRNRAWRDWNLSASSTWLDQTGDVGVSVVVHALIVKEGANIVSGWVTDSLGPSVISNCSCCIGVGSSSCASRLKQQVLGLCSEVTLFRGLSNCIVGWACIGTEFVWALEEVLSNWAGSVAGHWCGTALGGIGLVFNTRRWSSTRSRNASINGNGTSGECKWCNSLSAIRVWIHNSLEKCSSTVTLVPSLRSWIL